MLDNSVYALSFIRSCENGYIEIMEYPRAWEASVTYTETGDTEVITAGKNRML